ncbi:Chromosome partition protein Smc [Candidatus Lokiarchaeum ossiferum]|uniref:Chromosome partition protein Smc n=1 Tax=Candidatus Lokiarchaeum ossiferum TaxID=2951803 RepID=A0ABY6HPB9_9ARCH|nr:Chromosome partition protein Smc [Candidatus Lokiarchaeum sp. B-35]
MQNYKDLDEDTDALYRRIQNIKSMLSEENSEYSDGSINLDEPVQDTDEYREFVLQYIDTIKDQIEENHEEYEQLYRLKAILEQNVQKLSDSLNVARKQIERQNIKLSSMSKAKNDFENKEKEFELTIRDYQSQMRELKKNSIEIDSKIAEVTTKNSELAQEISELMTDNAAFQREKDQMDKEIFNLGEKLIASEQALEAKQAEYDQINDRIKMIENQVNSNEDNTDDLLKENIELGEGILEMEKTINYLKEGLFKFMEFIRPDLPPKSLYKILYCLIENKTVKVKEFKTLTNITIKTAYSDIKELENMGMVYINRKNGRSYVDYTVSLVLGDEGI